MTYLDILLRLGVAVAVGALLGLDRAPRHLPYP